MDNDKTGIIDSRATSICEEYCKYVVVDGTNLSILVNVQQEYYDELHNRLSWLGYVEIFKACVNPKRTITGVFIKTEIE